MNVRWPPTRQVNPRWPLLAAVLAAALVGLGPAGPPAAAAQTVGLRRGNSALGLGLAAGSRGLGALASYGYFVDSHVELGLLGEANLRSDAPNYGQLAPYAQLYLLTGPPVLPFVRGSVGRLFIEDQDDGWVLHGGVGVGVFLGTQLMLSAELYRERYYLPPATPEDRNDWRLGLGLLF